MQINLEIIEYLEIKIEIECIYAEMTTMKILEKGHQHFHDLFRSSTYSRKLLQEHIEIYSASNTNGILLLQRLHLVIQKRGSALAV
jgi:hypothetical protein